MEHLDKDREECRIIIHSTTYRAARNISEWQW